MDDAAIDQEFRDEPVERGDATDGQRSDQESNGSGPHLFYSPAEVLHIDSMGGIINIAGRKEE